MNAQAAIDQSPQFEQQIQDFITGNLIGEARQAFVDQLKEDRSLRIKVIQFRNQIEAGDMPISEKAATLINDAVSATRNGNMNFPGHSYISGLENRPDIRPSRERSYGKATELCQQLLALHELEDLALENIWIAEENTRNGRVAQGFYGRSSSESAFFGAMAAVHQIPTDNKRAPHWLEPASLRSKEVEPVDLQTALVTEEAAQVEVKSLIHSLPDQFPGFAEHSYAMEEYIVQDLESGEVQSALMQKMKDEPQMVEHFRTYLASPITGAKPVREVVGRGVVAKLLVAHYEAEGDQNALTSVADLTEQLLKRKAEGALTKHTADLLEMLAYLTFHRSNEHDGVWRAVKPILIDTLESGNYEFDSSVRSMVGELNLLRAVGQLNKRIGSDQDLHDHVVELANSKRSAVCYAMLDATCALPLEEAVPILVGYIGKTHEEYEREKSLSSSASPTTVRNHAAFRLGQFSPEEVKKIRFPGDGLAANFSGELDAEEALDQTLKKELEGDWVGRGHPGDFQMSMVETLQKYDADKAYKYFWEIVSKTQSPRDEAYKYIRYIEANKEALDKMDEGHQALLTLLGRMEAPVIWEDGNITKLIELLKERGETMETLAAKLAQGKPTQNRMLLLRKVFPPVNVTGYFRSGLIHEDVYVRIQGMRSLAEKRYAEHLKYNDIRALALRLGELRSVRMGFLHGNSSEHSEAETALLTIAESRPKLVLQTLGDIAGKLETLEKNSKGERKERLKALRESIHKTSRKLIKSKGSKWRPTFLKGLFGTS